MSNIRSVADLDVRGKQVLVRVDFNVPLDESGAIADDSRIRAALPTLRSILDRGGSAIVMSHMGRPKGEVRPELSLKPCAARLGELLQREVKMAPDCVGTQVKQMAAALGPGQVLMLENLRFHLAETKPESDPKFAKELASLADLYVNDAFGTAHRIHSSTCTIVHEFKGAVAAGFLLEKEVEYLGQTMQNPKRPFLAIIGGAKVSSKLGVLEALAKKADGLMIGGGMAFTLLKASGKEIGKSLCEDERVPQMREWLANCAAQGVDIQLPVDLVVAKDFSNEAESRVVTIDEGVPAGWMGLDIGPASIEASLKWLGQARTVLWNGPLGVFEFPNFAKGTLAVAKFLAGHSATSIVGGGDSVAAVQQSGLADKFSHLSTGGGASLEYVEYGTLPAIEALKAKATSL